MEEMGTPSGGARVLNTNTVSDFVNSFLLCVINGLLVLCLFASLHSCSCARLWPLFSILCSAGTLLRQRGCPTFPQVLPPPRGHLARKPLSPLLRRTQWKPLLPLLVLLLSYISGTQPKMLFYCWAFAEVSDCPPGPSTNMVYSQVNCSGEKCDFKCSVQGKEKGEWHY